MADTTLKIGVAIDPKSSNNVYKDVDKITKEINRRLKTVGIDFQRVAQYASSTTSEIKAISDSAEAFSHKLSSATKDSVESIKKLGEELEKAEEEAGRLREEYAKAGEVGDKTAQDDLMKEIARNADSLKKLTNQSNAVRAKEIKQLTKLVKLQDKYQDRVQKAAEYDFGDMFDDFKQKLLSGNAKGALIELGGGLKKSIMGGIARGGLESAAVAGGAGTPAGAEAIAAAASKLGLVAAAAAAAAAVFVGFVAAIKAASEHMTGLNKALMSGAGFVSDFASGAGSYREAIDDMRNAAIASHYDMLKFGKNSEDVMKIIGSYAKESTGSMIEARNAMRALGNRDVQAGMYEFAKSAIVYGKALNMEAEETAAMMGKFQSEIGYGFGQIQGLMQDIVKQAATSGMATSKFMDIFRSVIPNVELYQNRIQELTGTIKLLSKTMSPQDVKRFMDAFQKGFGGTDFKQRLKTVLMVGTAKVNETLKTGFKSRAMEMAADLKEAKIDPSEFERAFRGGEKAMASLLAKVQARTGGKISGTQIGEIMKLTSFEAARQKGEKGDVLSMATALRGASAYDTYDILREQSQRFTKGFDGLSEHVIQLTGITEQQYLAMRQTSQSMKIWDAQIAEAGITSSESMNKAIEKKLTALGTNWEGWSKLTKRQQERIIFESAQEHDESMNTEKTAADLAEEQVSLTTSLSDKISNVIAYLLEKIYDSLQGILGTFDEVWSWLTGGTEQKAMTQELKAWKDDSVAAYEKYAKELDKKAMEEKDPNKKKDLREAASRQRTLADETKSLGDRIQKGISSGRSGSDVVRSAVDTNTISKNMGEVLEKVKSYRMSNEDFTDLVGIMKKQKEKGAEAEYTGKEMDLIYKLLGSKDVISNAMIFGKMGIAAKAETAATDDRYRRAGTEEVKAETAKERKDREAAEKRRDFSVEYARRVAAKETGGPVTVQGVDIVASPPTGPGGPQPKAGGPITVEGVDIVASPPAGPAVPVQTGVTPSQYGKIREEVGPTKGPGGTKEATDALTSIRDFSDSINTQVMGISMHLDKFIKIIENPGIRLDKSKYKSEIAMSILSPMFSSVLEKELSYFLFALLLGMEEENKKAIIGEKGNVLLAKGAGIHTLAGTSKWSDVVEEINEGKDATRYDWGGPAFHSGIDYVPRTGLYQLQQGEGVTRRGEGGRSIVINANVTVNDSGDPQTTAAIVVKKLYELAQRS